MTDDLLSGAPKPGAFVQSHLLKIIDYIEQVDGEEFLRLQMKDYSSQQFRLSYPFFKTVEQVESDGHKGQYWATKHVVQGQQVRVCNDWYARHRPFFLNYLTERQIPADGLSPELCEEWLAIAEQAGTTSKSPGGARYKTYPIGVAQNAFVRYLLSNLGHESFTKQDWKAVKSSFGDVCVYCGRSGVLQMDHAIPLSRLQLGEHRLGNLVPACPACNGEKSHLRFRSYLEAKNDHDPRAAERRIAAIEAHMARHSYRPLGDRQEIRDLVEQARQEIAAIAARYVELINQAIDHGEAGQATVMSRRGDESTFADMQELLGYFDAEHPDELVGIIDEEIDGDVDLFIDKFDPELPWILTMPFADGAIGVRLEFPMTEEKFWDYVNSLDEQVNTEEE
ncbi:MAG TPA: HNH endonuclease [Nocardioidaceae bacterium]|nr:HNH endonuclease [Nocardioidaceae bacterium]